MAFTDSPGRSRSVAISVIWRGREDGLAFLHSHCRPSGPITQALITAKQRGGVVYDQPTANQLSDTSMHRHRRRVHRGAVAAK